MKLRILVASLTAVLCTAISASATPFTNGSFESSTCPPPGGFYSTLLPGATCIDGWEVVVSNINYLNDLFEVTDGHKALDLNGENGGGGIKQTFDTVSGQMYQVLFDLAGNPGGLPIEKSLTASAAANSMIYTFDTTGATAADMNYVTRSFFFTATSTSTVLQFLSNTPQGPPEALCCYGPVIDNVRVQNFTPQTAVPEPASLLLLGTGFLGLARRRFKK